MYMHHSIRVEVRIQLLRVSFLLSLWDLDFKLKPSGVDDSVNSPALNMQKFNSVDYRLKQITLNVD